MVRALDSHTGDLGTIPFSRMQQKIVGINSFPAHRRRRSNVFEDARFWFFPNRIKVYPNIT